MNKNDERLIDTIKNVKTSTVINGLKRLIRGCWTLFLIAFVGLSIMQMISNERDLQYLIIPFILALIELKTRKVSNFFLGLFR